MLVAILKLNIMLFWVKKGWYNLKYDVFHHYLPEKLEQYSKNVKLAQISHTLTWHHVVNGLPSLCWVRIHFWGVCVQCRKTSEQYDYWVGLTVLLLYCQDTVLQLNKKFLTSRRNRLGLWLFRTKGLCS